MISGLVANLTADAALALSALQAIRQHPALELGPQDGRRLPLVLETATPGESHQLSEWLYELPGVEHIDVAFVHWDDELATVPAPRPPTPDFSADESFFEQE
jgi:hypothetical protein